MNTSHAWKSIRPRRRRKFGDPRPSEHRCTICGLEAIEDELGIIYSESVRSVNGSIKVVIGLTDGSIQELDCAEFAAYQVTTI